MKHLVVVLVTALSMLLGSFAIMPVRVDAAVAEGCSSNFLGLPAWYKYLDVGPEVDSDGNVVAGGDKCAINGPRENGKFDWQKASGYVAVAVLEILLRIGALVAVGFVMYGGFRFITSQGDPEGAKNARNTIINAIIGLVITIASASIVAFIANRLTS